MKILIIEDNEMNLDMLARRLRRVGFEVSAARDGFEGVRAAQTERPNLILMDLSLPELDGWEAARRIKSNALTRAIPIIALTAHALPEDKQRALAAGCDDYDTKPVNFTRLLSKIRIRI